MIPYGIDGAEFRPRDAVAIAAIQRRYGARLVLAVGRLVYYKGFEYLIRAMTNVRGHLLIVGDGPLRARLRPKPPAAGSPRRVTFLGNVTRAALLDYYQAADVFALPSVARSEAFGIVQLEAMASGVPVVNTRLCVGGAFRLGRRRDRNHRGARRAHGLRRGNQSPARHARTACPLRRRREASRERAFQLARDGAHARPLSQRLRRPLWTPAAALS